MSFFGFSGGRGGSSDNGEILSTSENQTHQPRVELEAFQAKLRNKKILLAGPFSGKYPPILEAIQDIREPFRKTVLLTSGEMTMFNEISIPYDAIFKIHKDIDWSLALTYISHVSNFGSSQSGSTLVVSEGLIVPDGFFKQIHGKPITFINLNKVFQFTVTALAHYDACFFPHLEDVAFSTTKSWYLLLNAIDNKSCPPNPGALKDILTEIRVAGAGLCWIRNSGQTKSGQNGNLFWYDPIQSWTEGFFELTKNQISSVLKWILTH